MEVHYDEGVATHIGPEPCAGIREDAGEASVGECIGQPWSRETIQIPGADAVRKAEGNMDSRAIASDRPIWRGLRPWHVRMLLAREPGDLRIGHRPFGVAWSAMGRRGAVAADEQTGEVRLQYSSCEADEQSRSQSAAELVEPRMGTKGNVGQQNTHRTQSRESVTQALDRVRQAARQRKKEQFTALLHHINVDTLRTAFYALKRKAAPGVDGVTWQDYEADLEPRLEDLHARVHRGAYRPQPARRTYIPKADGKLRPISDRRSGG